MPQLLCAMGCLRRYEFYDVDTYGWLGSVMYNDIVIYYPCYICVKLRMLILHISYCRLTD